MQGEVADVDALLTQFKQLIQAGKLREIYDLPFPMLVFGTLRKKCFNHKFMGDKYGKWNKAFFPHFTAKGLALEFQPDATAACELFAYSEKEWKRMIYGVDNLESFSPDDWKNADDDDYLRTLAYCHVLPDEYKSKLFPSHIPNLYGERNLEIPQKDWSKYPKVPCWIYSNAAANHKEQALPDSVILFPPK
eukprot:TRINITY_DN16756_c0_g1_i1.p1 TRINITY_DN16756_c0_g1~~TRINITY_DN16756_c0_g1_i1.p1  ORF type:complete len:191 (+),score=29.20 TRINITY_DN16756_c0_g1_i1:430-1002(+)